MDDDMEMYPFELATLSGLVDEARERPVPVRRSEVVKEDVVSDRWWCREPESLIESAAPSREWKLRPLRESLSPVGLFKVLPAYVLVLRVINCDGSSSR